MSKRDFLNEKVDLYGLRWHPQMSPLNREIMMVQHGGTIKGKGNGLAFHFKKGIQLQWPSIKWWKGCDLFVDNYLTHRTMAVMGPASIGKTDMAAFTALFDYRCFPWKTKIIITSTTAERMRDRIWGRIVSYHTAARRADESFPGHVVSGRMRILTNPKLDPDNPEDCGSGVVGVPCKKGENQIGLADFSGFKADRLRLFGDEIHFLPMAFVGAISNLDKNPDVKIVGLGNPKDILDALGILAEPAPDLGGWDGGIDQKGTSKVWKTKRPDGCAVQLVASDSPNLDGTFGAPLITQEQINRDVEFWGKNSLQYSMFNDGRMPHGLGSTRVITRQECIKFGAKDEPIWLNSNLTKIVTLDAAYGGVGGDRCMLAEHHFGREITPLNPADIITSSLLNQTNPKDKLRQIIALIHTTLVPITIEPGVTPQEQIVKFCQKYCEDRGIPPENFGFDSGMRTSLVQEFDRTWSNRVQSIDCGGPASSDRKVSADIDVFCKDHYSKFVTELWFSFRMTVLARQYRGLTDEVIMEFAAREWGMVGANKIEVETKKDMRRKIGKSPDLADAVALGIEMARRKGFVIRQLGESRKDAFKSEQWKDDLESKSREFWQSGQLQEA